jgi:hypothetical protein
LGTVVVVIWGLVAFVLFGTAITSEEDSVTFYAGLFVAFAASCSLLLLPGVWLLRSAKRKALDHKQSTPGALLRAFEPPVYNDEPPVVFSGTVRTGDLIRAKQILGGRVLIVFVCVVLVVGLLLVVTVPDPAPGIPSNFSTVVMPWLMFVLSFGIVTTIAIRKWLRNSGGVLLNGSVDANGVSISTVTSQSVFLWSHWARSRIVKNTVVLQAHNGQISVFKREWFGSSEDWKRFVGYVTAWVKSSEAA